MRTIARLLAFGLIFLCTTSVEAQNTIKLASAQNSIGSLPFYVAKLRGFFAAENLTVETLDFKGGGPAVQALAGGSVDLCICAGDHAVRLRNRGLPAHIIAGLTERHGYGLLALATSPVTDLASMKGRKLGITSPGSLTDNTIRYSLIEAKLDPDRDVTLASIGTGIPMKAALDSGAIDAGMFTTPDVQINLAEPGKYKIVQDYRNLGYAALDLVGVDAWLKPNEALARKLVAAIVKAQILIQSDPAAVRDGIKAMFPTISDTVVELLIPEVPKLLAHKGEVAKAGYDTMVGVLGASEPELKTVAYADVVTTAYLPAN